MSHMNGQMRKVLPAVMLSLCMLCSAEADLAGRIDHIINLQKGVKFSAHIIEANSGKTVYDYRATKALIPASNMKIIVTAAALQYLSPSFRYITKVGLCEDTLVIIGSGDPLLGNKSTDMKYNRQPCWIFEDIATKLKRLGVETIKDIIVDSSIFDDQRVHPNWPRDELNRWYACEVSGLNFIGNCITITAENNAGDINITIEPATSYVRLTNRVSPISKGKSSIGAYRKTKPNSITIRGKCKDRVGPFDVAIEKPAMYFGFLLAEKLSIVGINTRGKLIEKALTPECDFRLLTEYSTSIADCLERCNKDSLGLAAEALLKTIGAHRQPSRKGGSWAAGSEVISQYLMNLDIDQSQFYIDDGSGLSRENRLSANAITRTLYDIYKSDYWEIYESSLSVGGVDGTIEKYFKEEKYKGNILGKTGYITAVKSFSGICSTNKGDYIFAVIANKTNGQTRQALNDIAAAIIDEFEDGS